MRWLIYILGIYMLSLSVCPCLDTYAQEHTLLETAAHQDSDHAEHSDACSPLCVCTCCGISLDPTVRLGVQEALPKPTPSSRIRFAEYQDHLFPSYLSSIWRPPQSLPMHLA